jgi:hypothetical protein
MILLKKRAKKGKYRIVSRTIPPNPNTIKKA